jgi:hypothetical protein
VTALLASHGSNTDVLVNGLVVSQYFNQADPSLTRDKAEASAFKQMFKSYVAGLADGVVAIAGLYDGTNATAEDPLLYGFLVQTTAVDNYWIHAPLGAQGSGAFGNPAKSISGISTKYEIKSALNSANLIAAEVQLDNTGGGLDNGLILSPWVTQGSAGTGSSTNNAAGATANGGVLIVHAFSDAASLVVNLQDSADNVTFANVSGYTVSPTNSVAGAYRYPAAGTVPSGTIRQYTRVTWTGTGTFLALFSRK